MRGAIVVLWVFVSACGVEPGVSVPGSESDSAAYTDLLPAPMTVIPTRAQSVSLPAEWSPALVDLAGSCGDVFDDVYKTPPLAGVALGAPLRCEPRATLDQAQVEQGLTGLGVDVTTGVRSMRIAYRTQHASGEAIASSAIVYVPLIPRPGPLPIVVIGHPSEGLADSCAPSRRDSDSIDKLALPFAGRGFAVIVPDLPGLGNEGTQAYLDNHEQAYALLDGARALRKFLKPGAFSSKIVMVGFSQGGGAVLASQALAKSYGADGELVAVTAIAAQYPTRLESFGFMNLLQSPDAWTISYSYTKPVVAVLRTYAWFSNSGREPGGGIPLSKRSGLVSSIESLCLIPFGGALQSQATHVRDFIDDELRQGLLACATSLNEPLCTGNAREYFSFLQQNHLQNDPQGAKVLYIQGLMDTVMPANEEASCNVKKLRQEGVNVTVCTDSGATHANVAERNIQKAIDWIEATLAGATPAGCTDALPTCP